MNDMHRINFARYISIIYTLIIAVPLTILSIVASENIGSSLIKNIMTDAKTMVSEHRDRVVAGVEEIERLESIVTSDSDLLNKIHYANADDTGAIIDLMRSDVANLDRLRFALPRIYGFHIFTQNENVPERWPIVFSETRLDFSGLKRWNYNYRDDIMGNIESSKIPSACLTREILLNKRHVGFLQISMKMEDLFPFAFDEFGAGSHSYIFSGPVPLIEGPESMGLYYAKIAGLGTDLEDGVMRTRVGGKQVVLAWSRIPRIGLLIVHPVPLDSVIGTIAIIRLSFLIVMLVSIAIMFFFIDYVTKRLVTRLYAIMDGMRSVRKGDLDVSVHVAGHDEVSEMAEIFTAMVERIKSLISEIKQEQSLVTQTEIKAMQNQINAHFLYNVLETIKMQAELRDEREIAESLTLLGRMMRFCLRWRNHRVYLRQEIDYVRDYIAIMNIRNDYVITLAILVDEKWMDVEIPKMLIQPVVENAVLHAIEPLGEDGVITISASVDPSGKVLLVSVKDTGAGMDSSMIDSLGILLAQGAESGNEVGGIGLRNIQQRLRAFYGPDYSLRIQSAKGEGTEVIIPVLLEGETR